MKIMISQPMNGKSEEQIRNERENIIKQIKENGDEYVDTVIAEEPPKDSNTAMWYLAKSIEIMSKVDIVYFMRGWENARGCRIENKICQDYGKQTLYRIYERKEDKDEK